MGAIFTRCLIGAWRSAVKRTSDRRGASHPGGSGRTGRSPSFIGGAGADAAEGFWQVKLRTSARKRREPSSPHASAVNAKARGDVGSPGSCAASPGVATTESTAASSAASGAAAAYAPGASSWKKETASRPTAKATAGRSALAGIEAALVRGESALHTLLPPTGRQLPAARHLGASSRALIGKRRSASGGSDADAGA